ncbi:STAS domain-containing protein [Streptomyces sp. URMC 123]|uniref:STAS domain-containing protein n=1 Tax=Streptomyces sp. URMC 123 TaxID=3423403 RepID=UPI003F1CFBE3
MTRALTSGFSVRRGQHVCVPYGRPEDAVRLLPVHLTTALEHGEKIIYVCGQGTAGDGAAGQAGQVADRLSELLAVSRQEVGALVTRGQLAVRSDLAGWPTACGGRYDAEKVLAALLSECEVARGTGYLGLRVCVAVPATASRTAAESESTASTASGADRVDGGTRPESLTDVEQWISTAMSGGELAELAMICHYDQRGTEPERMTAVRRAHPAVLDARHAHHREPLLRVIRLADRRGLRLGGEIDRTNIEEFAAALVAAFHPGESFHLELDELRYADVAAVRLMVQTAEAFPNGHRVVLHSPAPLIRATLRIYGWDRLPTLLIEERSSG